MCKNLADWEDTSTIQQFIVYELDELKELVQKLDQDGVIACNVDVPESIKKMKSVVNKNVVGKANLIPSESNLNKI